MLKIWAILTSHNRRQTTLECLRRLEVAARFAGVDLKAVLVDDGSSDGTADAVRTNFDWVRVIHGDGNLFWCRGMHRGFAEALKEEAAAYLWVNDDTHVVESAIARIIEAWRDLERQLDKAVVVSGATADQDTGKITYGGNVARSRLRRFTYTRVWDSDRPVECHVAQGNFLLIPKDVAQSVGNLDPVFEHAMGDMDYSLRLRQSGFGLYVAPGVVGYCSHNSIAATYRDASLPLSKRLKKIMGRKGLPPASWLHFTRRHGGGLWPLYFVWPYFYVVLDSLRHAKPR